MSLQALGECAQGESIIPLLTKEGLGEVKTTD